MKRSLIFLIIIQLALIPVASAQTGDGFTSAGVANPDLPATGTGDSTGTLTPSPSLPGASTTISRQACLGTDLLLNQGFTQSELDRLKQENKLSYLDSGEFLDSDGDGLADAEERAFRTDPNKADTDGDGFIDAMELIAAFDPLQKDARLFAETYNDRLLWVNQVLQSFRHALNKLYYPAAE